MLTWRKQRLYFRLAMKDVPTTQRRIDLVSQNRAIKYNFTQWHEHKFCSLSNFFLLGTYLRTNVDPNIISSEYVILVSPGNGEPRSTCLHKEEICGGRKFIKEEEYPHSVRCPRTDNGWRWRSRPDNATDLGQSVTFASPFTSISSHHFLAFSQPINRTCID